MGILEFYGRLAARPSLIPFNRALLKFVARGMGYGLFGSLSNTGEQWFIRDVLASYNPTVCFDIGANVGGYSQELIDRTDATVHAFEPVTINHDKLTSIKSGGRLHVHRFALGGTEGEAEILIDSTFTQTASLVHSVVDLTPLKERGNKRIEIVPLTTIDAFCKIQMIERLDFIKIDSEGYELEILTGAQKTLRNLKPQFIQFEFGYQHLSRRQLLSDVVALLPGYRIFRLLRTGMTHIDLLQPTDNLFILANYIAVRDDLASNY